MDRPNGEVQQMQHGSGRYSYALNSWMQALAMQRLLPTLQQLFQTPSRWHHSCC